MTKQNPAEPEEHKHPVIHNYPGEAASNDPVLDQDPQQIVHPNMEHEHGPQEVAYGADELVVLCLVRNGRTYAPSSSTTFPWASSTWSFWTMALPTAPSRRSRATRT